jgi:hypothetical protein
MVYVPLLAVFPDAAPDFASFCSTVRSLSRTDTIFWCARLNLILSNPQNLDEKGKQEYAVRHFFDESEIGRLNAFAREHATFSVFFRDQLLELVRWTCLLADDHPDDGRTFEDPATRRRFAQAALMAGEVWGNRVFKDGLPVTGDHVEDLRRAMPAFRRAIVTRAPDLVRVLARGASIYEEFQRAHEDLHARFRATSGLTLTEYLACLWFLTIQFANINPATAQTTSGGFRVEAVKGSLPQEMQEPFDRYIQLESQTADELRSALWGDRAADDVRAMAPFDDRPFRNRPILRTPDGRAIVLDQVFYAGRASVGPLFTLVNAAPRDGRVNTLFGAFGDAFESYVNGLLRSMYPARPPLAETLTCNPTGTTASGEIEIADACLNEVTDIVLFESKAVFVRDDATGDVESYESELRKKLGATEGTVKDRGMKGAAQLGRWIVGIARGDVTPAGPAWDRAQRIFPVLVVYDTMLDRPGHARVFEEEFRTALVPASTTASGYMRAGRFTIAPPTVMTIDDLENLASSVERFSLVDLLRDYVNSTPPGTRASLHDFMAMGGNPKYRVLPSKELAERAIKALEATFRLMFPNLAFPPLTGQAGEPVAVPSSASR